MKSLFIALALFCVALSASAEIYLDETDKPVELWRELYVFEEPEDSQLNWQQVYKDDDNFKAQEKPTLNFGYRNSPIWLKVKLTNKTKVHRWGVSIDNAAIDFVDMFLIDAQGELVDSSYLGDMRPFSDRKLQTASQSASFDLPTDQHVTLMIKVYGQSTLFLPVLLATERQIQVEQNISMVFVALLVGIMFALGLNNLYLYYSIGDKTYAYYCFYLTSLIGFSLYTSGMGYQYFWRDLIEVQNVITFVFLGMLFHGALAFSQHYLRTEVRLPSADRFINYFKYLAYSAVPISLLISKSMAVTFLTIINITFILTVIYCGVQSARQRYAPAYFYLASWFFLVFGLFTYNLTVKGVIEPNFFTTKAIAIGSAIEAILLSSALAFRMRNLILERNKANKSAQIALVDSNREMAKSLAAAEQYNTAKDEFLSVVNHELRTPMNGVLGNLQLMEYEELSDSLREYVRNARTSSNDLMNIIDNMLFITESSSQQLSLNLIDLDARLFFKEILSTFQAQAMEKNIKLEINVDNSLAKQITIDRQKFEKLLELIIDNAIKFTAEGTVIVDVSEVQDGEKFFLQTVISDTGVGMDEEQLGRLFTPFSQANTAINRSADGLGLGLTVAKQIAEFLGAELLITSQVDKGTQVSISMAISAQ
jgi:two-component system, sensor histidine kinase LadS